MLIAQLCYADTTAIAPHCTARIRRQTAIRPTYNNLITVPGLLPSRPCRLLPESHGGSTPNRVHLLFHRSPPESGATAKTHTANGCMTMPTPHRDAWRFLTEPDHDRAISFPRYTAVLTEPVPTDCSIPSNLECSIPSTLLVVTQRHALPRASDPS